MAVAIITKKTPAVVGSAAVRQNFSPGKGRSLNPAKGQLIVAAEPVEQAVLVVVDMQDYFEASMHPATLAAVKEEILLAVRNGDFIVVLEVDGCAPTQKEVMAELNGYNHYSVMVKRFADGSEEVLRACQDKGVVPVEFKVVGVNTDCCVSGTVANLSHKVPQSQIVVIAKACNTFGNKNNWRCFPTAPNIVVQQEG